MTLKSTAQTYWESHPNAAAQAQWTSNPTIGETVYRRMSGGQSSKHWLFWLLEDYFQGKHFQRVLSPGCGVGDHEIILAQSGIADRIDTFDFSETSLQIAREKARKNHVNINFYQADLNTFTLPAPHIYDLVLCSGSVHHVKELERFLATIHPGTAARGLFCDQ
jgi:2-polyprenyl-3-methyl-5-hydroxy-6-metoxy-1,4-benzoquinol methylase